MTAFTQIPSLVSFTPLTTILSADVNANYAAIRNAFNGLVSGSNTIAVDTITENTAAHGVTVNKAFTVSAGVLTAASGVAITGGVVSGIATFSSGLAITGGVVSGAVTLSSGFAVTAGVATFSSGITVTGAATVVSGLSVTGGTSTFAVGTGALTAKPTQVFAQSVLAGGGSTSYSPISAVTLPANSLAATSTQLRMRAAGFSADTGWNVRWTIGSTVVVSATQAASGAFWRDVTVARQSATQISALLHSINGSTVSLIRVTLASVDLTADQIVSLAFVTSTTINLVSLENYCVEIIET